MRPAAAAFVLIVCPVLQGCRATQPGKVQTAVMTKVKHSLFVGDKKMQNPIALSPASVQDGKEAFTHYCVACHGLDGQNTGVPFADRMDPPVPSLTSTEVQTYTDGQLKWVINNGIAPSGMPASMGILSDEEQWDIVIFIRHLPPAGSLGEPSMYGN
jgi:cytochrome c